MTKEEDIKECGELFLKFRECCYGFSTIQVIMTLHSFLSIILSQIGKEQRSALVSAIIKSMQESLNENFKDIEHFRDHLENLTEEKRKIRETK